MTAARVTLGLFGIGLIGYGALQLAQLALADWTVLPGIAAWWLAGPVLVDAVVVPVVVLAGVAIHRYVPPAKRRYVAAASALTVMITLVAVPFLTGLGRRPDNPSLLDRNYVAGYLALLALVWLVPPVAGRLRTAVRSLARSARR